MATKRITGSPTEDEVISSDEPEPQEEPQCEQEAEPDFHPLDMAQRSKDLAGAIRGEAAKMELGSEHLGGGTFAGAAAMRERDPWQHRAEGMKCLTCMWWARKAAPPDASRGFIGRCRKHAPTLNGYPVVYAIDWCGDHKLNEHAG